MKLKITKLAALAAATAIALGASAAGMSDPAHVASKERIAAEYKSAKAACDSLPGNTKDVCVARAKGAEKVGLAELAASHQPSAKARYDVRLARAEADYGVAKEQCGDRSGNAKDICVREAQAVRVAAKADAKAQMKTTDAKAAAGKEIAEARKDANAEKSDAGYAVARAKCDAMSGAAKDACVGSAKANFGKS